MVNQAKLRSHQQDPFWKFRFLVPCTYGRVVDIDLANGNSKWQDSEAVEIEQLEEKVVQLLLTTRRSGVIWNIM
jgi:hypothetical protein